MADVGRLVRVDVGVLHDNLAGATSTFRRGGRGGGDECAALEEEVDVPAALDARPSDSGRKHQRRRKLRGDRARRFLECLCEIECGRRGEVSQLRLGWPLQNDSGKIRLKEVLRGAPQRIGHDAADLVEDAGGGHGREKYTVRGQYERPLDAARGAAAALARSLVGMAPYGYSGIVRESSVVTMPHDRADRSQRLGRGQPLRRF